MKVKQVFKLQRRRLLFDPVLLLATTAMFVANVIPVKDADLSRLEKITIFSNQGHTQDLAGSADFIGLEDFEKPAYSDIQRVARALLGVSIQVEGALRRALN